MEEGKNIFLLDGPIGRKKLYIFLGLIMLYSIIFSIALAFIIGFAGYNIYTKPILIALLIFFILSVYYLILVNYAKRLANITNLSLKKSLLYVVLLSIGLSAMKYIPILKYVAPFIGIVFFICLVFIKGHPLNSNKDIESVMETQTDEDNTNLEQ